MSIFKGYRVVTLTFREENIRELGKLLSNPAHNYPENAGDHFHRFLAQIHQNELFYLITCNRLLFLFHGEEPSPHWISDLIRYFHLEMPKEDCCTWESKMIVYSGAEAVNHILEVASSLDSLVVGEREILGQFRKAYKYSLDQRLAGPHLRFLLDSAIRCSRQVYTHTRIANNPVSIVSLAYTKMIEKRPRKSAKIILTGAGQTNTLMAKYLQKEGFKNITIFNRTLPKARDLAALFSHGQALLLSQLDDYKESFDILITCIDTTANIFPHHLLSAQGDKIIVDLAVPGNIPLEYHHSPGHYYINIDSLRDLAQSNMTLRKKEITKARRILTENISDFQHLLRQKKVARSMSEIPKKIREIKCKAIETVFQQEISKMDSQSRDTLYKVIDYIESKYISIPISIARKALETEHK